MRGVDAPERRGETIQAGNLSRNVAYRFLTEAREIIIVSYMDRRSFTRWIADVYVDGDDLAKILIDAGCAVEDNRGN